MKPANIKSLNLCVFYVFISFNKLLQGNINRNIGHEFINEFFTYLSKWKPHTEIMLIHSCKYNLEFRQLEKLSTLNSKFNFQFILLNCKRNKNILSALPYRDQWKESLLIFYSNDLEEMSIFIDIIVNQSYNKKATPSGYFFVLTQNLYSTQNQYIKFHDQIIKLQEQTNVTTTLHLNSNMHFVICCQNSSINGNKSEIIVWSIFEFYFLNSTKLIINRVFPIDIGKKGMNRMNFYGIQLRATAPEKNLTQGEIEWGNDTFGNLFYESGFGTSILKSFQHSLNFEIVAIPTDGWAKIYENGSWDGMAKRILEESADIGIAKTSILPVRAQALGYLIPIHTLIVTAFFRQPPISSVRNIFTHPFETWLWIIIICTWIVIIFTFVCLAHCQLKFNHLLEKNDKIIMQASGTWAITAISQHGFYITPNLLPLRIVFLIGICFGVLIFVAYSATLVSIFTSTPIPIKTFTDLLKSRLTLAVDTNNAGAKLVAVRGNNSAVIYSPAVNLLLDKVSKSGNSSLVNAKIGGSLVFERNVAFLTFKDTFYTTIKNAIQITEKSLCNDLSTLPVTTISFRSGLFVAKNSPYKEMFNNRLICLCGSGIMKRYVQHYEATYTPICNSELESQETPSLGNSDVFFAYIILTSGFLISSFTLLLELLTFWKIIYLSM